MPLSYIIITPASWEKQSLGKTSDHYAQLYNGPCKGCGNCDHAVFSVQDADLARVTHKSQKRLCFETESFMLWGRHAKLVAVHN